MIPVRLDHRDPKGERGVQGPAGSTESYIRFEKIFTSTEGQTSFSWTDYQFPLNRNALEVYVDGVRQDGTTFTENSDGKGIKLKAGLPAGYKVHISGFQMVVDLQGPKGEKGAKGDTGATGAKGDKGATGATGAKGADGATWLTGTAAPSASQGKDGDFFLNTSNFDVYKRASGAWSKTGNIKGATGATGATGAKGETGAQGPIGAQGPQGAQGAKGVSMRLKGAWASGTAYVNDGTYIDIVTYNGSTYACAKGHTASSNHRSDKYYILDSNCSKRSNRKHWRNWSKGRYRSKRFDRCQYETEKCMGIRNWLM